MPQCAGARVGAMDSKEDHTEPPNSDANWLGHWGPIATVGSTARGKPGGKGFKLLVPPPFTAGQPLPCWYGPWTSIAFTRRWLLLMHAVRFAR